jgi:xylose isomerase
MLIFLQNGGFTTGGVNFDAKVRRNSTDLEDLFLAHIGSMDAFARGLLIANDVLEKSEYNKLRKERYASFDQGKGKEFSDGNLKLEDLRQHALDNGEPEMISGKQELFENIINQYI